MAASRIGKGRVGEWHTRACSVYVDAASRPTLQTLSATNPRTIYVYVGGHMPNEGLKELYVDELKDLYSAENQLVKALPKMAKAASATELQQGFEKHLKQTEGHVQRLEEIFQPMGESPKGKKCMGMEGLVKEGAEVME